MPSELDSYAGKYSQQPDFQYFRSMLKMENYKFDKPEAL
jgi:hypothetical protein